MLKRPLHQYCLIMVLACVFLAIAHACNSITATKTSSDIRLLLPQNIPDSIYLSPANPFSAEKAALGRYFFYDRRLSVNQSKSCSSCHDPAFSFTDGYRRSIGALGDNVQHNAPALINIIYSRYLTASDSTLHFPEQQISNPMFHTQPVELGWRNNEAAIMERIKKDSFYNKRLHAIFWSDPFTTQNIQACISDFVKTLISFDAPYDRYLHERRGSALSPAQNRGMRLFFSDSLHCSRCHGGITFSVPQMADSSGVPAYYQNTGLYNMDERGSYPPGDGGLYQLTGKWADMGKFKIPTLRNLAFTAPYLHDGSAAGLDEVIADYQNGGRLVRTGPNQGDGTRNPLKSPLLRGFVLKEAERHDLIVFLLSLSDSSFCHNKQFSNPFTTDETVRSYR